MMPRTILKACILTALLCLTPALAAKPPGATQVITDPAFDTDARFSFDRDVVDLRSVTLQSGAGALTITFTLTNLYSYQAPAAYTLSYLPVGAPAPWEINCNHGDYSLIINPTEGTHPAAGNFGRCLAQSATCTKTVVVCMPDDPLSLTSGTLHTYSVDYATDQLKVTIPYSALGLHSGQTISSFQARTGQCYAYAACEGNADLASSTMTYVVA